MRTHLSFKISIPELAEICGMHATTLKRQLKRAKIDKECLPSVVRWLYPRLMMAQDGGINTRKQWKAIQKRRAEAKERRKAHAKGTINALLVGDARHTLSVGRDDVAQEFPSYD